MTMLDLKPCPFCGKDAKIAPDEIGSGGQHVPPYHAGCFRGGGCGFVFTADDPDEAAASWNRRALSTITPAEAGGLVARLRSVTDISEPHEAEDGIEAWNWLAEQAHEAATALEAQAAELASKDAEIVRLTAEKDAAEFAVRNIRSLDGDALHAVRELLNSAGVPKAAFIDDHVGNAIAQRDAERGLREAAITQRDEALKALEEIGNGCDGRVDKGALPCRIARRALTGGKE